MGQIVPFRGKEKIKATFDGDFTEMLKDVVKIKRESLDTEENGIFHLNVNFEDMLKAKIGSFIIDHRLMNADIFRCGLYVSQVLGETLSKKIESYYVSDYFIRGIEEDDPLILLQGADLCCVLCIFFEERQNWRLMRTGDYMRIGIELYSLYHSKTKRVIGWCMSRNFESIIAIARKCIEDLERRN